MLTTRIIGANGKQLKINGEGEITATIHTHPPIDEVVESLPFRAYFRNSSASNDMRVNGSVTNVEFSINADSDFDYYIKSLSIKLADAGATFDDFGNLGGILTNGVEFYWQNQKSGKLTIHEGIKDNLEFFRLSKQNPNIIDLSGAGADALIVEVDFEVLFGTRFGIRLVKGTTDKIVFTIKDDITGLDEFNIIGYGIKL